MKNLIVCSLLLSISTLLKSQSITLDTTFGVNGQVTTDLRHQSTNTIVGVNMSVLPNGSIIVGGEKDGEFSLQKFNPDGSVDTSFTSPQPHFSGFMIGTSVQQDGKMIVCGTSRTAPHPVNVIRLDASGLIDSTFGTGGMASTFVSHIYFSNLFEQQDGKIVVFGCQDLPGYPVPIPIVVTRLLPNGSLDSSFANHGQFTLDVAVNNDEFLNAGLQQPDGKLLFTGMAGWRTLLVRLNLDGSLDPTFGTNGIVVSSDYGWADALTLQTDGKIVLLGDDGNGRGLFSRYNPDGSLDTSFGHQGLQSFPETYEGVAVTMLPNGKILGALKTSSGANVMVFLAQLLPDGRRDSTFGNAGIYTPGIKLRSRTLELLGNTAILGGQTFDYKISLVRFILDLQVGTINPLDEPDHTMLVYPNPIAEQCTLAFGLAQSANARIQLYDLNGRLVETFVNNQFFEQGDHQLDLFMPDRLSAGAYVLTLDVAGKKCRSILITKK